MGHLDSPNPILHHPILPPNPTLPPKIVAHLFADEIAHHHRQIYLPKHPKKTQQCKKVQRCKTNITTQNTQYSKTTSYPKVFFSYTHLHTSWHRHRIRKGVGFIIEKQNTCFFFPPYSISKTIKLPKHKSNMGLWLVLIAMIIITLFGLLKFYLDSLTQTLSQEDISEDMLGKSLYIAKENSGTNYNLVSTPDEPVIQVEPDTEAQAWENILSQLKSNTGLDTTLTNQTWTKTELKTPEIQLISNLYQGYNTEDKNLIFPNLDTRFKNSEEYLTYFRTTRMKTFVNALDGGLRVSNFKVQNSDNPLYKTMVTYQVQYTLNESTYIEDRNAYLVLDDTQDQKLKIKRLYCTSKNCSKGPFFNFQKFNIY
jgi:hypothetical protein